MGTLDWKDQLKALAESDPNMLVVDSEENDVSSHEEVARPLWKKLDFITERKGRKGKTATIITGFECSDDELREVLKTLQKRLGTGGSARDGEILLQGDWAPQARAILLRER